MWFQRTRCELSRTLLIFFYRRKLQTWSWENRSIFHHWERFAVVINSSLFNLLGFLMQTLHVIVNAAVLIQRLWRISRGSVNCIMFNSFSGNWLLLIIWLLSDVGTGETSQLMEISWLLYNTSAVSTLVITSFNGLYFIKVQKYLVPANVKTDLVTKNWTGFNQILNFN